VALRADSFDVVVVGGGLVGAATAWGLARTGQRVAVLDEGDNALRASRGNFALVWVQSKGLGMPAYAQWTRASSDRWVELAGLLREDSGIDVAFSRPGGFTLCLSEAQLSARVDQMRRLHNSLPPHALPYEILDRAGTARMLPQIGPDVVGSVFCPLDGHVNSLRFLSALHGALKARGVQYRPGRPVARIMAENDRFLLETPVGMIEAGKIVLAAGLGNAALAPMVGLNAPVRPQRGQIMVTEKLAPFLAHPIVNLRQTDEGGVMISGSLEEAGFDDATTLSVLSVIAQRAIRMFPLLREANIVRAWSALRVMSPDGFPIYQQSARHPGAFLVTCHSGVTLAAAHALVLARQFAAGQLPPEVAPFTADRFDVSQAA
jgi:glycine/D-amino acid oxidase-like deaminating enzyme